MTTSRITTPEALIAAWDSVPFASSTQRTPQFNTFAAQLKTVLNRHVAPDWSPVSTSIGHFILSGFLQHRSTGAFVYWAISDVRFSPHTWHQRILIRAAAHSRDYQGGPNHYTTLTELPAACTALITPRPSRQ
jgi:hypothetical protein